MPRKKMAHFFVQQGGSTHEMYVHGHNNIGHARRHQVKCESSSYNVSQIFSFPRELADAPGFDNALEKAVDAAMSIISPYWANKRERRTA